MKIAVLSDIHDNIWNLKKALKIIEKQKVKSIIFCGDMCAPSTTVVLAQANLATYACLGNVDEDHIGMQKMGGNKFTWFHLAREYAEVKIDKRKIAFCHYPKLAELLAKSDKYNAVFHGHTHVLKKEKYGKTLLVNPGPVCGFSRAKSVNPTFAVYSTETNTVKIIEIK